jgi:hypothetical protein
MYDNAFHNVVRLPFSFFDKASIKRNHKKLYVLKKLIVSIVLMN